MSTIHDIEKLINGNQPLIWVNSFEERRVIDGIINSKVIGTDTRKDKSGRERTILKSSKMVFIWSSTQGLVNLSGTDGTSYHEMNGEPKTMNPVVATQSFADKVIDPSKHDRGILIMRDFHTTTGNPMSVRKLKDVIVGLAASSKNIIIVGPSDKIPDELQKDIYLIDYNLPTPQSIKTLIKDSLEYIKNCGIGEIDKDGYVTQNVTDGSKKLERKYKVKYKDSEISQFIRAVQGLTESEITCALSKTVENSENGIIRYDDLADEKQSIIKKSQVLEFCTDLEKMNSVGGFDTLKKWFKERESGMSEEGEKGAIDFGARVPKGALITGIQGCGKSMICKAVASSYKLPLIRLDMGKVFAGLVGSSEKNMRDVIKQAESMSPTILWIDEIENGVSGSESSNYSDGGTSSRVFGTLVTWLNEKRKKVFVIATANDISQLPPKLLRKGRFDAIWFVDLPTFEERKDIFKIHISKIGRKPSKFDLDKLARTQFESTDGELFNYSGSEIEEAINDTLYSIYHKKKNAKANSKNDIKTDDIIEQLKDTVPLSCTAKEKLKKIRKWGTKNARFASSEAQKLLHSEEESKESKDGNFGISSSNLIR